MARRHGAIVDPDGREIARGLVAYDAADALILADMGTVKDGKPVELKSLPPDQQAKVLAKLKATSCYGMKSGVTTSLVKAENLCGNVIEVMPQQGLGQSYLPTKAAFQWQADRWVGLITRLQTAQGSTMKAHHGTDERIHMANLFIVPATNPSWGYGLYLRPDVAADAAKKATAQLTSLKTNNPCCSKRWTSARRMSSPPLPDAAVANMKKVLAPVKKAPGEGPSLSAAPKRPPAIRRPLAAEPGRAPLPWSWRAA